MLAALGSQVKVHVVLDSDLRDNDERLAVVAELERDGASAHMWRRKELESYVLEAEPVAIRTGLPVLEADALLERAVDALADQTRRALQARRLERRSSLASATVLDRADQEFDEAWASWEGRLRLVAPKDVLHTLNRTLQGRGLRTCPAAALARAHTEASVPEEARALLLRVEADLA